VKAGSIHETKENNGISHFIEHMLFKGTETYTAKGIAEFFDARGADLNAFTSKECTCYHAKVLDHHLTEAIEVIADMICHPLLDAKEIEKEINVVLDEIKMAEDTPDDVSYDLIARTMFKGSSLSQTILGLEDNIRSFKREDLINYMDKYYTSDQIIISIAGSYDEQAVVDTLNTCLNLKKSSHQVDQIQQTYLSQATYITKDTEQVQLEIAFPGLPSNDKRIFPMAALNAIWGGSVSSRLFQVIREEHGLTYSINSYLNQYEMIGSFSLFASMDKDNLIEVLKLIEEERQKMIDSGISLDELNRVKEQLKGNYILELEGSDNYMGLIGKNKLFNKPIYDLDQIESKIDQITLKDIRDVIHLSLSQSPALSLVGRIDEVDLKACQEILGVEDESSKSN